MIVFITRRFAGEEAGELAKEVESWIARHLGGVYAWPGNFRELEQCVRNVLIRREYAPPQPVAKCNGEALVEELENGSLTADQLLRRYCTIVYGRTRNLEETARRLKLDRRTVKAKVDWKALGAPVVIGGIGKALSGTEG